VYLHQGDAKIIKIGGAVLERIKRRVNAFARDGEFINQTGVASRAVGCLERIKEIAGMLE
jgi:hypothetical protein